MASRSPAGTRASRTTDGVGSRSLTPLLSASRRATLHPWQKMDIPNGVDLNLFQPGNRRLARRSLGLPEDAFICLSIGANGAKPNPYKDFSTVARATKLVLEQNQSSNLLFIRIGGDPKQSAEPRIKHSGYIEDEKLLAAYYQAADIFVHGAKVESFSLVILEAMACGIPTIASDVGGIPELVKEDETGFLVPPGDSVTMSQRISLLITNAELQNSLGKNALSAARNLGIENQAKRYVQWFQELLQGQTPLTGLP